MSERLIIAYHLKREKEIQRKVQEINKERLDRQRMVGEAFRERRGLKNKMPEF
jgi:hypothetical protein